MGRCEHARASVHSGSLRHHRSARRLRRPPSARLIRSPAVALRPLNALLSSDAVSRQHHQLSQIVPLRGHTVVRPPILPQTQLSHAASNALAVHASGLQHFGWDLYLLVVSLALVWVGARSRPRVRGWLRAAGVSPQCRPAADAAGGWPLGNRWHRRLAVGSTHRWHRGARRTDALSQGVLALVRSIVTAATVHRRCEGSRGDLGVHSGSPPAILDNH